jgi:predicted amidohydrolase YtcJ
MGTSKRATFAVALALSGWSFACAGSPPATGPADLIVFNARVFTAEPGAGFAEAVAIRGNRITGVGGNAEMKALAGPASELLDARGGTVMPGFNDSHVHFLGGSLALDKVNLLEATTLEQIQEKIRAFAASQPEKEWVLGRGWYYAPFPGGLPTREQLDALVRDRPAYMTCYDGHTGWANSKALERAGITRDTPNPVNGIIVKDPKSGEPTGVLKEAAQRLMTKVLPQPSPADKLRALRQGFREAHRFGVTSVQNASGNAEELQLWQELRRAGELALRSYSALSISPGFSEADADRFEDVRRQYPEDPLLRVGAVKLVADGVIEAHTAFMLAPYTNQDTRGVPNYTPQELNRIVALMDRRGWQIFIHAIGDAGIRMALDAFHKAAAENPAPARGRRHRIEHIESTDAADIPRFGKLGVIAAMQPFHGNPSPNQIDVWAGNIGPDRAARAWVWKSIQDGGGRLSFGSDWPVVSIDPRLGVQMAVNRTTPEGGPPGGWLPEQRLPLADVLGAYTAGAAYAEFAEDRKGALAPGKLADLVVLSADVFALPREKLLDAVVEATVFDGKVVYRRQGGGPGSAAPKPSS